MNNAILGFQPFRLTASGLVLTGPGYLDHFTVSFDAGAAVQVDILDDFEADKVTNGTFTGNATGWTLETPWAYNANNIDIDGSQLAPKAAYQSIATLKVGKSYVLTYTITRTAGTITPKIGGTAGTTQNSAATYSETIVCGADDLLLKFTGDADFAGTLDTVTLSALPAYTVMMEEGTQDLATRYPCHFDVHQGIYVVAANVNAVCGSYFDK